MVREPDEAGGAAGEGDAAGEGEGAAARGEAAPEVLTGEDLGEDLGASAPEVAARLAGVRPLLDDYVREVMRAQVAAALFGTTSTVKVGRYELRREVGSGGGGSVFLAWDPELTREVALKLIVATEPRLRARALAEGQSLARLSHPNVVPVFDVGVEGERVYLVMELIRGESLRAFAAKRKPREIIAAYRQACEGLAAAHREKLVHRDFKPDNAVVGSDGRVRVIDFGLAIDDRPDGESPALIGGTPRYMSPEQRRGELLGPATDQYAFAVSLREALSPLPSWLEPILGRAQAERPADRFPSMDALGARLALDPATRWRRRAVIAVPLALGLTGYAVGQLREPAPSCDGGAAALAPAWTAERRAALIGHITGLATPYATVVAPQLATSIEGYAAQWIATHRASCLAHAHGELAPRMYDRRQLCLASARTQLATLVEFGAAAAAAQLEALARALPELPDPAGCVSLEALSAVDPPTPGQAAGAAALAVRLDRARVHGQASPAAAEPELAELVRDARALGYRPLLSSALLAQGTAYLQQWKFPAAEAPLGEANVEALRSRDYPAAVEAFARLAWVRSKRANVDPERALEGLEQVDALADGLPVPARFGQALLHNNVGGIQLAAGHLDRARAQYQRSIELAASVTGPGAVELSAALQGLALTTEEPARRRELFAQRLAILRERLGEDHPLTLTTEIASALTTEDEEAARRGLRPPCQRLAQLHPTHGWPISECNFELGWLELARGDLAAARGAFEASLAGEQRSLSREISIGFAALLSGDPAGAMAKLVEARAQVKLGDKPAWSDSSDAASLELGLGLAEEALGKREPARATFERALGHLEAAAAQRRWMPVMRRLAWVKQKLAR
jgi:eukaryotic-like serine/threonine-protein kinase